MLLSKLLKKVHLNISNIKNIINPALNKPKKLKKVNVLKKKKLKKAIALKKPKKVNVLKELKAKNLIQRKFTSLLTAKTKL